MQMFERDEWEKQFSHFFCDPVSIALPPSHNDTKNLFNKMRHEQGIMSYELRVFKTFKNIFINK
jgi:hypothetical protein